MFSLHRWQVVLLVAGLWAVSGTVEAQVLCPSTTYSENALLLEVTAAADVRRGNASNIWVHDALCGRFELGKHWASVRFTHAFGRARVDGTTGDFVHALRALPEYRYRLVDFGASGSLRAEALLHYERDPLRRIAERVQPGLGANLSFVDTESVRLSFTLAYVFSYQQTASAGATSGPDAGSSDIDQRGWGSLELGWDVDEHVYLGEELIVQVPLGHCACATRLYAQSHLRVRGNEWLSLEVALLVMYDPRPAQGVDQVDTILRSGLVFTL